MTRISGVTKCSFAGLLLWAGALLAIPASAQQTCTFTFSPASENFLASGGTGTFTVTASSSTCVRNATASASWITITFGNTGTGNGTVGYAVAANTAADQRTGTITIGNQTFTI